MSESSFPERYGDVLRSYLPGRLLDSDENTHVRRMEGWDESWGNEGEVGRFAIPPYRWFVVPKSAFPERRERENHA